MTSDRPLIILASGSSTRAAMLRRAGLDIEIVVPLVDEDEIKRSLKAEGDSATDIAIELSYWKARQISLQAPGALVIGADQMLECDGLCYDKPADRPSAAAQLRSLSGRKHRLVSAAMVCREGARLWHIAQTAELTMRPLSDGFIETYLDAAGDSVTKSVGCYQIEGLGAQLFSAVAGDPFVIMGLPLLPLFDFLRNHQGLPT